MKSLYLLVDIWAVIIPFIYSFHKKIRFNRHFKAAFTSIFIVALPFIAWDIYFTKIGVWGFNKDYLIGIYILNLPLEEILFFICIPFSCLFTYYVFRNFLTGKVTYRHTKNLLYVAFILLIISALYNSERLYTLYVSLAAAIVLHGLIFFIRRSVEVFLITFMVLLIPFFIVNGILTGTGIDNEVVWYNNTENLGIRILTIPVEDFFYAFTMIALNVIVFEKLSDEFNGRAKA